MAQEEDDKPRSLRDIASDIAANLDSPRHGGRDVSKEPRILKGNEGAGRWTTEGAPQTPSRSRKLANSHTPKTFLDDHGDPVFKRPDPKKPPEEMQLPDDVDMRFFVDQGLAAANADIQPDSQNAAALDGLANFARGGPWDIQRVGPENSYKQEFRDAANVAIGLYGAAAGLPQKWVLAIANQVGRNSNFGPNADMSRNYSHLTKDNVYDIKKGYELFRSGGIKPSTQ